MKKFEDLNKNYTFNVGVWEIKPFYNDEKFLNTYALNGFVQRLSFSFIKSGENSCKEMMTGTEFNIDGALMSNDETGLYFFGLFVNDKAAKNIASEEFTISYFEMAKQMNSKDKKKIKK